MTYFVRWVLFTLIAASAWVLIGADPYDREEMTVKSTGYCPCAKCCGVETGRTATGSNAYRAGVAVDPRVIPHGSYLDIPGYDRGPNKNGSWIKADDTGRLVKGEHIDIRFESHEDAVAWGRRYITVTVWKRR